MRDTKLRIDLDALEHNVGLIRGLAPSAKCMAMLKANAYGHGSIKIAEALEPHVDGFGLCTFEEALKLRKAGIKSRLLILQGVYHASEYLEASKYQIECVVHNLQQVDALLEARSGYDQTVWLKANTGMNRLGLRPESFQLSLERLISAGIRPVLMSHLACADHREHVLNKRQIDCFESLTQSLEGFEKSLLNSAGLVSFPNHAYDWIRPGLALYGISPFHHAPKAYRDLRPVMNFEAKVISRYAINLGESVGYTARWHASRKTELAIVAVGYGDGYPRDVPNGTPVLIGEHLYPTAGVVSMDALAIDVTDGPEVPVGAVCRLWGEGVPVEAIAHRLNRIPYELVTQVTGRPDREVGATLKSARRDQDAA